MFTVVGFPTQFVFETTGHVFLFRKHVDVAFIVKKADFATNFFCKKARDFK